MPPPPVAAPASTRGSGVAIAASAPPQSYSSRSPGRTGTRRYRCNIVPIDDVPRQASPPKREPSATPPAVKEEEDEEDPAALAAACSPAEYSEYDEPEDEDVVGGEEYSSAQPQTSIKYGDEHPSAVTVKSDAVTGWEDVTLCPPDEEATVEYMHFSSPEGIAPVKGLDYGVPNAPAAGSESVVRHRRIVKRPCPDAGPPGESSPGRRNLAVVGVRTPQPADTEDEDDKDDEDSDERDTGVELRRRQSGAAVMINEAKDDAASAARVTGVPGDASLSSPKAGGDPAPEWNDAVIIALKQQRPLVLKVMRLEEEIQEYEEYANPSAVPSRVAGQSETTGFDDNDDEAPVQPPPGKKARSGSLSSQADTEEGRMFAAFGSTRGGDLKRILAAPFEEAFRNAGELVFFRLNMTEGGQHIIKKQETNVKYGIALIGKAISEMLEVPRFSPGAIVVDADSLDHCYVLSTQDLKAVRRALLHLERLSFEADRHKLDQSLGFTYESGKTLDVAGVDLYQTVNQVVVSVISRRGQNLGPAILQLIKAIKPIGELILMMEAAQTAAATPIAKTKLCSQSAGNSGRCNVNETSGGSAAGQGSGAAPTVSRPHPFPPKPLNILSTLNAIGNFAHNRQSRSDRLLPAPPRPPDMTRGPHLSRERTSYVTGIGGQQMVMPPPPSIASKFRPRGLSLPPRAVGIHEIDLEPEISTSAYMAKPGGLGGPGVPPPTGPPIVTSTASMLPGGPPPTTMTTAIMNGAAMALIATNGVLPDGARFSSCSMRSSRDDTPRMTTAVMAGGPSLGIRPPVGMTPPTATPVNLWTDGRLNELPEWLVSALIDVLRRYDGCVMSQVSNYWYTNYGNQCDLRAVGFSGLHDLVCSVPGVQLKSDGAEYWLQINQNVLAEAIRQKWPAGRPSNMVATRQSLGYIGASLVPAAGGSDRIPSSVAAKLLDLVSRFDGCNIGNLQQMWRKENNGPLDFVSLGFSKFSDLLQEIPGINLVKEGSTVTAHCINRAISASGVNPASATNAVIPRRGPCGGGGGAIVGPMLGTGAAAAAVKQPYAAHGGDPQHPAAQQQQQYHMMQMFQRQIMAMSQGATARPGSRL